MFGLDALKVEFSVTLPPHYGFLMWLLIVSMTIDIIAGYVNAVLRGEASSDRLRKGIVRRAYLLAVIVLLTLMFSSLESITLEVLGFDVHVVHVLLIGSILAEAKSIAEKARMLGLGDHPVIQFLQTISSLRFGRQNGSRSGDSEPDEKGSKR